MRHTKRNMCYLQTERCQLAQQQKNFFLDLKQKIQTVSKYLLLTSPGEWTNLKYKYIISIIRYTDNTIYKKTSGLTRGGILRLSFSPCGQQHLSEFQPVACEPFLTNRIDLSPKLWQFTWIYQRAFATLCVFYFMWSESNFMRFQKLCLQDCCIVGSCSSCSAS